MVAPSKRGKENAIRKKSTQTILHMLKFLSFHENYVRVLQGLCYLLFDKAAHSALGGGYWGIILSERLFVLLAIQRWIKRNHQARVSRKVVT